VSDNPSHWGVFGDYIGGLLNPVIALATLAVTFYIFLVAQRLETSREQERNRPIARVRIGDYENRIEVYIRNMGLGPMEVTGLTIDDSNKPDGDSKNLVDHMPAAPAGIYWTTFTLAGPPPYIHENGTATLIKLEGDPKNKEFSEFREQVREALQHIKITVAYSDIYGTPKTPETRDLAVFGRHRYGGD
jgi:hypothetical protein